VPPFSVGKFNVFAACMMKAFNAKPPWRPGGTFAPVPSFARHVGYKPNMSLRMATWPAEFPASFCPFLAGAFEVMVGHKPKAVSEMVSARARGFDRDCPHGVFQGFHVTAHVAEPFSRARNLLSKDDWRASLLDETVELRP